MNNTNAEIELQVSRTIDYLIAVVDASTKEDLGNLHMHILNALDAQMQKCYQQFDTTDHVTADQVLLHVQDRVTHRVYNRSLPLDYGENNNGITLRGETLNGTATEIAFLSDTAVTKINELLGHGADKAPCDNHG